MQIYATGCMCGDQYKHSWGSMKMYTFYFYNFWSVCGNLKGADLDTSPVYKRTFEWRGTRSSRLSHYQSCMRVFAERLWHRIECKTFILKYTKHYGNTFFETLAEPSILNRLVLQPEVKAFVWDLCEPHAPTSRKMYRGMLVCPLHSSSDNH